MKSLIKAFLKTSTGSLLAIIFGALAVKIVAVVAGPYGVGFFSIVRQVIQTLVSIATLQGNTAVVQGICNNYKEKKGIYITSSASLIIAITLILSLVVWFFPELLSKFIFDQIENQNIWIVRSLIPGFVFGGFSLYFIALLNGYRLIGKMAIVQALSAICGALAAYPLLKLFGNTWGIVAILWVISGSSCIVSMIFSYYHGILKNFNVSLKTWIDVDASKYFIRFALVTFVSGLAATGGLLVVRLMFLRHGGMEESGLFEAAWMISNYYLMIFLSSLSTYYMPVLASSTSDSRIELINNILSFSTFVIVPMIAIAIIFKEELLSILYSKEFEDSVEILRWLLLGGFFKVFGWILATPMLAFAHLKHYLFLEIMWYVGFIAGSWYSLFVVNDSSMVGLSYVVVNILYLAACFMYVKCYHKFSLSVRQYIISLTGFATLCFISYLTWGESRLDAISIIFIMVAIAIYLWVAFDSNIRKVVDTYFRGIKPC